MEENVTIPKTIHTIKTGAFAQCKSIITVFLEPGSKLTTLEKKSFYQCSNLKQFPFEQIISIGHLLTSLTSISFGPNLREIFPWAFAHCNTTIPLKI